MTGPAWLERSAPLAPAFFLVLAAASGGLRSPEAWLFFGVAYLCWTVLRPGGLSAAGQTAALLFFCWLGAAAVFSPEPAVSLAALGRYGLLGLFFFSAASGREGERGWLAAVYGLGGLAAAVLLVQRLASGGAAGLIGLNPNYSAAFCAAAFAPAAAELSAAGGKRERYFYGLLALLLAAGIAASGSRGAALAGFGAAACGFALRRSWRWLAGLLVLAAAGAALLPGSLLENLLKFYDPRAFARPRLWGAALDAAAASPLLGWGPGRFGEVFEFFKFPYFDGWSYYGHSTLHAHSELMNLAAEAGFPAAILFLLAAWRGLSGAGQERLAPRLAALAVLLQACADMTFYSGAVSLLFWGSLGYAAPAAPEPAPNRYRTALAAALLACLLLPFCARFYSGGSAYVRLARAESGGNPALALALARADSAHNPKSPFAAAGEGAALAAAGDTAGAAAAYRRALSLEPGFADARLELATLLAASGDKAEGCAVLARLPGIGPGIIRNGYDRALWLYDQRRAAALQKDLCGKTRTGTATAIRRRTRSKATK